MGKRLFIVGAGLALGVMVMACSATGKAVDVTVVRQSPAASAAPNEQGSTLLTVRSAGGRCLNGLCESLITVRRDGSYTYTSAAASPRAGSVAARLVADLTREVAKADWKAIKSVPFTGTCPTAYDGQEQTYTFNAPGGAETIASCQVQVDERSPLFIAVRAIVDEVNRE